MTSNCKLSFWPWTVLLRRESTGLCDFLLLCLQCARVASNRAVNSYGYNVVGDGERCGTDEVIKRKVLLLAEDGFAEMRTS